jgi:stage II sporulation protein P
MLEEIESKYPKSEITPLVSEQIKLLKNGFKQTSDDETIDENSGGKTNKPTTSTDVSASKVNDELPPESQLYRYRENLQHYVIFILDDEKMRATEMQYAVSDFNMAYYNAALAIRKYIEEYPSVSYILDIHRDSIVSGDGWVSPVTQIDGRSAAQMMFVVGTDHGGSGHTGWQDNLALAVRLQKSLSGDCPALMRDINLRSASFNAQYASGSLLVEIGSCASTLDEAKTAAERFADHLAREILGN